MCIRDRALSTFSALVFTAVNIQAVVSIKPFLTLSTWIQLFSSMRLFVALQISFPSKPFVTHCIHTQSWLVIRPKWMLSDMITIRFNLHLKWTFTCTAQYEKNKKLHIGLRSISKILPLCIQRQKWKTKSPAVAREDRPYAVVQRLANGNEGSVQY